MESFTCIDPPVTTPGGNPVTALPGVKPRSPEMRVGPVLVTVLPPRTANVDAVPRATGNGFAAFRQTPNTAQKRIAPAFFMNSPPPASLGATLISAILA